MRPAERGADVQPALPAADGRGVLERAGIAGCVRLPVRIDATALASELARLPEAAWREADRDPVVGAYAESFFAIGHPRGPVPRPPDERAVLDALPLLRAVLRHALPARPVRAIVQRLQGRGFVPLHRDTRRYFSETVRVSFLIAADGAQRLSCDGLWYAMAPGEVWALDNLRRHGVVYEGAAARLNVLADFAPSPELLAMLDASERDLGVADHAASATLERRSRRHYASRRWQSLRWELGKVWRRSVLARLGRRAPRTR